MKRHIQKTGVRKFFGQDFIDLQAEPLKALDAFFAEYGACVIQGCEITEADGGTFNIAPGLVALESTDPDSGAVAIRTMPFTGADTVALPLYLFAEWVVVERAYGDGKVKPIAHNLLAVASGIVPEAPHLVLTDAGGNRFVDAVQDGTHRFVSDTERAKWNDILRQAKEYAATQVASSQATAVGLAKAHTDGQVAAVRDELALGDQAALNTAKAYADRIVAALVDGSPEMLNTLEELASALGGDPNFATTVMQAIGERATNTNFNTHTQSEAHVTTNERTTWNNKVGNVLVGNGDLNAFVNVGFYYFDGDMILNAPIKTRNCRLMVFGIAGRCTQFASVYDTDRLFFRRQDKDALQWSAWVELYHSGNSSPVSQEEKDDWGSKAAPNHKHSVSDISGTMNVAALGTYNCNEPIGNSFVVSDPTTINAPTPSPNWQVLTLGSGARAFQIAHAYNSARYFVRYSHDSGWSPWTEFYHTGNLKIIRGSVTASGGNGGGNAEGIYPVGGEEAVVRVTHSLGTHAYSATASTVSNTSVEYTDNVVSAWRKTANYVDFVVTRGPDNSRELCAFDFIIIPH